MSFLDLESLATRIEHASPRAALFLSTAILGRVLPITRGMGLKVTALDDVHSEVTMPLVARTRNHVGGMYLGALMIVAEIAMASYVLRRFPMRANRVLVKGVTSENTAQAKGMVRATCRVDDALAADLARLDALAPDEKGELVVPVTVVSVSDERVVARVAFTVSIKRRAP